jgi:hypothetical protein
LTSIDPLAFYRSGITKVTSLGGITTLPPSTYEHGIFSDCPSLTDVTLPNTLIQIGNGVFRNSTALTTINFPNSIVSIGNSAFLGDPITNELNLPNLATLSGSAFQDTKITKVVNLGRLATLEGSTFYGCTELVDVILPETLTSLSGTQHFMNCTKLESIKLLSTSVPSLSSSSFINGSTKCKVYVPVTLLAAYCKATN